MKNPLSYVVAEGWLLREIERRTRRSDTSEPSETRFGITRTADGVRPREKKWNLGCSTPPWESPEEEPESGGGRKNAKKNRPSMRATSWPPHASRCRRRTIKVPEHP